MSKVYTKKYLNKRQRSKINYFTLSLFYRHLMSTSRITEGTNKPKTNTDHHNGELNILFLVSFNYGINLIT